MKFLLLTCLLLPAAFGLYAQNTVCTTPGQNPSTAFPVCGTSVFTQSSVPICGGKVVPAPTCNTYPLQDVNPFWYKFTCFQSGTLGFTITPHTNSEDYDWELFDITNRNPDDVYSDINLVVACNWSGEGGKTGTSSAGTNVFVCEGMGRPLWSKMPSIVQGHDYILLVSHFTQTQSGYDLSFSGGTAVITDPTPPHLKYAEAACAGNIIRVKLNKKMKCSSIAADGSDFNLMPASLPIISANAIGCSGGFDSDSVELHLNGFLAPGNYTINVKQGTDNNTIIDNCENAIPSSDQVSITVFPLFPTPMDSLIPLVCKPQSLKLVFRKSMLCSSVSPDGSDFIINGPYPVSISGATGNCTGTSGTTKEITINLSQPLFQGGNFTLALRVGNDGNTILDECTKETPPGSSISFSIKDTVNADFSFEKRYGCNFDTIYFSQSGGNGINSWHWDLDDNQTSQQQNPAGLYHNFTNKHIQLAVSNGFCSDTSAQTIVLDNFLKAGFTVFEDNCPNEPISFTSTAQGNISTHKWDFADGGSAFIANPQHTYAGQNNTNTYLVKYTVTDSLGCISMAQKPVKVYSSCYLAVPSAFTPNGDGLNDFLGPLNAIKADKLVFKIFNRWGQQLFETNNWKNGWDGTYKGIAQGSGIYIWFLNFTDRNTGESRQMKGTAALIR